MFKPEPMAKIVLAGHKKDLSRVIDTLHSNKVMHLVEHKKGDLDIGTPLKEGEEVSFLLVRIRALIDALGVARQPPKKELKFLNLKEARKDIAKLHQSVQKRTEELASAQSAMGAIKAQIDTLEKLTFFKGNLGIIDSISSLSFFIGETKPADDLEADLKKMGNGFDLTRSPGKGKDFIFLALDKKKEQDIAPILQRFQFRPEPLEHVKRLEGTPKDCLLRIYPEYVKLKKKCEATQASLTTLRSRFGISLLMQEAYLETLTQKTEAPLKFAVTQSSFIVTGWVPEKRKAQTITALNSATKNRVAIVDGEEGHHEVVPVKLRNPSLIAPFEFFLDLYSLPSHHEIDPTFFIFLGFPLFFGIMLGDIGYGLVALTLFLILMKVMPQMKRMLAFMTIAALSTLVFGFVFGEFFGAEELFGHEIPYLIHRTHDIQTMIMLSVIIGVLHVSVGLLIGFYNEARHHGVFKAITAKLGWLVLLAAAGILLNETGLVLKDLGIEFAKLTSGMLIGGGLFALAIVMLFIGEGVRGLVELPGIFGNVLSYARLMALGVASASLAVVVNNLALPMFKAGIAGIIAGVLILFIGHLVNFALGLIGPFLHSLRLHYVEFFTKFYQGGGTRYIPFGTK